MSEGTTSAVTSTDRLKTITALSPVVDLLSKATAAFAIALYICGFLIVSLYHSQYGFVETNPFRPRILAAGAWFVFLAAIPIASVTTFLRGKKIGWTTLAQSLYPYYFACMIVGGLAAFVFNIYEDPT